MSPVPPRAYQILRGIAVLGVLVALVGTILTWRFLGDLERTTERSLLIGQQATVTLNETIDVADEVLAAVDDGLLSVQSMLGTTDDVLRSTTELADATGSLSATLPQSFEDIDVALATVQRLGETVDSTLSTLNDLPFGPDYDPEVPFPDAIAELRRALDPIAEDLTRISGELQDFADGSGALTTDLDALESDLRRTRDALAGTDVLLDQYRDAAEDAGRLAESSRGELESSIDTMRGLLLALALLLVVSQYVPWTLAAALERRVDDRRIHDGHDDGHAEPDGEQNGEADLDAADRAFGEPVRITPSGDE